MNASSIETSQQREVGKPHAAASTPCPPWCTARHDDGPRPHAGRDLVSTWGALPVRLYQLGLALVRAADTLRRARQAAESAVTA